MRLKRLLGMILPLLLVASLAAAAGTRLAKVEAAASGNVTTLTILASGEFTHTEYRPSRNLMLVDLAGVAAADLNGTTRQLDLPGVESYRVLGFRGASGADMARVELRLEPDAEVNVRETQGGLVVAVSSRSKTAPARKTAPAAKPAATVLAANGRPAVVRKVGVVRAEHGLDVEILTNAPVQPQTMTLTGPDRLVIDLPGAVPAGRTPAVTVSDPAIKAVRWARYQNQPPVTRVVVDLAAKREFDVVTSENGVTVKLREPGVLAAEAQEDATLAAPAQETEASEAEVQAPAEVAETQTPAEVATAQTDSPTEKSPEGFVMVEPQFQSRPASPEEQEAIQAAHERPEAPAVIKAGGTPPDPLPQASALARQPAVNLALEQQQMQQQGQQSEGPQYTGEPISVNLKDVDLKDFFRLIHEISGLNVVLDPNVKGNVTLVLEDVPWDQALDIVLKNNGLDKQVEGNVLRIATVKTLQTEAEQARAKAEAEALAVPKVTVTRYLSYAKAADLMPTLKKFMSQRGDVVADARTNALIIQDIPSVIPEIDRVIGQLDRKPMEVEIEARVVAATRSFARDIGTQFGFGWGNNPTAVGGGVSASPLAVGVSNPLYFTTEGSTIPLFSNLPAVGATSGLAFSNATSDYRLDFILTMAESRGLLKILSRPRVVTQNNVVASVRQGVRIPIVTQAQLGGPPTVTYVAALLQLTVTPQITVENTIFLNVDVENTVPDFSRTIQENPTLITQQATTSVLISDGGTVVIGGVIQTQNSVNVTQVPLLGDIPILGQLFKRRNVSTSTQELLFFITPKIIQT